MSLCPSVQFNNIREDLTDGTRLCAERYSSERQSRSPYHTRDFGPLQEMYPTLRD